MALEFPWAAFMEAQRRKQEQKNAWPNALANIAQVATQAVVQYGQNANKQRQSKQVNDWLTQQQQPIQKTMDVQGHPNTPIASYDSASDQTTPIMASNPNGALGNLKGLPPEILAKVIGPMVLAQQKQTLKSMAPLSRGMQAEIDMNNRKNNAGVAGTPRGQYYASRATQADVGALSGIEKNIDPSVASRQTPVGAAASSVRRVYNGLTLLNNPIVTKPALEATMGDVDAILTQASATVQGRQMLASSNIYQKVQDMKAYLSSQPDKVAVTPALVNIYKQILTDLGPVSQSFILDRVKQQGEFYRPQAEKLVSPQQYNAMLERVTKSFTIPSNLMGNQPQRNVPGIQNFNSVQEAEGANLPKGTKIMIGGRIATVQ